MGKILHKADSRGLADHGWLISRHSFSFAEYYEPQRMNFGLLRVINDDIVKPAMGFATHPHRDMEIISIPLSGALRHEDSMANKHVIMTGEIQVMSAGSGVTHSEYNNSATQDVNFLQIWIQPRKKGIPPRYGQKMFHDSDQLNHFQTIISPATTEETVWINQNAYLSMAHIDAGRAITYNQQGENNGLYFFVIAGRVTIDSTELFKRDAMGLTDIEQVQVTGRSPSRVLCIEVPMTD
ncbi:MAG: pirin family protein [Deltaproteobacteria bacterium]|nr:pirin family protein [Deltaproteobacteria bacterium]